MNDIAEIEAPFAPLRSDEIKPMPTSESEGELVLPVPADAPLMPQAHFKLGQLTERWFYRDPAGAVLFAILRFDKADGSKEFLPLTIWRNAQGLHWRWKSVPTPRPLYNLHELAARPDAPGVICEGENQPTQRPGVARNRWRRLRPVVRTRPKRRIGLHFAGGRF